MSTVDRTQPKTLLKPLVAGQRLSSPRFTSATRRCRQRLGPSWSEELCTCRLPCAGTMEKRAES